MSKLETVRAFSDSAPPPERLRSMAELQTQLESLSSKVIELGQTLMKWAQGSADLSQRQRQQMLDLGSLIEPIPILLAQIQRRQQAQDDELAKIGLAVSRLTAALPPLVQTADGRHTQPRLAGMKDLANLPTEVWKARPETFDKR